MTNFLFLEMEYRCLANGCERTFNRRNMLEIHLKVYHSISHIIDCRYCDKEFIYESDLKKHQQIDHPELFNQKQVEKTRLKQIENAQNTTSILKRASSQKVPTRKSPVPLTQKSNKSNKSAEIVDSDQESDISVKRASDDFSDSNSSINLSFSSSDSEEKLQRQFSGNKLVCRKCQILFQDRSKLKSHRRLMHNDEPKFHLKSENLTRSKTTLHITSSEDSDEEGDLTSLKRKNRRLKDENMALNSELTKYKMRTAELERQQKEIKMAIWSYIS